MSATRRRCKSALDLCTGSGCLAILLAHAYPGRGLDAVDISADALAVAQRNVSDYGLADRINLIRSDLFANLPAKSYDLIISNPPYVDGDRDGSAAGANTGTSRRSRSPAATTAWTRCARSCARRRNSCSADGMLVVEIGHNRAAVEAAFPRLPFVWLATASSDDSVFLLKREEIVAGR